VRAASLFAATLNVTVPLPVPDAPAVTAIHDAVLLAVHWQVFPAETAIEPVPPAAPTFCVVGEIVALHAGDAPAPACAMVAR
jgi:hypothetical protein